MADKRKAGRRAGGADAAHLPLRVLRRRWATRAANAPGAEAGPPAGVATGPMLPLRAEPSRSIGPDPLGGPARAPAPVRPAPPEPDHVVAERPVAEPPAWAGGHDPLQRRHAPAPLTARRPATADVTAPRASGLTPLPQRRAGGQDAGDAGIDPGAPGEGTIDDINALMDFLRRDDA